MSSVILTPDQRLRVFVSSTLEELADERLAARRAVERLRLAPVMFELGARPHPPRSLYLAYLRQSHVFVGVYWQRYGWVAPDMDAPTHAAGSETRSTPRHGTRAHTCPFAAASMPRPPPCRQPHAVRMTSVVPTEVASSRCSAHTGRTV